MEDLALLGLRGGGTEKYLEVLDRADSMRGFFFIFFMNSPLRKYALLLLCLLGLEGHLSYRDYNENSMKSNVWKLDFSLTGGWATSISIVTFAALKVSISIEPNSIAQT